jgi:hypothetical protein
LEEDDNDDEDNDDEDNYSDDNDEEDGNGKDDDSNNNEDSKLRILNKGATCSNIGGNNRDNGDNLVDFFMATKIGHHHLSHFILLPPLLQRCQRLNNPLGSQRPT